MATTGGRGEADGPALTRAFRLALAVAAVVLATAGCAQGTEGLVVTAVAPRPTPEADLGTEPIQVWLPRIPAIELPDLTVIGNHDDLVNDRLGELAATPIDGVEVVRVDCEAGARLFQGDQSSDVFDDVDFGEQFSFSVDQETGAAVYSRSKHGHQTRINTFSDGSGTFLDTAHLWHLSIEVAANGAGEYFRENVDETTTVEVDAAGSGTYYRRTDDSLTTITILPSGAGELFSSSPEGLTTIAAAADGSGDMYHRAGDRTTTLKIRPDGSWELHDRTFYQAASVIVDADGSGQYHRRGGGTMTLDFAADGSTAGPDVVVPPTPSFEVADRFPALGTLASIEPPCATILRFDAALLFDVDLAVLKPDAIEALAAAAPALIEVGQPIDVTGHTDANGSDEHNLDLSLRRAEAVAAELERLGVTVPIGVRGAGESEPMADNYLADGSDDLAGQAQNRRVELLIADR